MLKLSEGSSLRGTVFNLVNSVVGGGIVSLPFAVGQCGLLVGSALLLFVALMSDVTVWMLIFCVDATRERSYARVAEVLYGRCLGIVVDLLIFFNNLGAMVGYVIIIGDLIPTFMAFAQAPPLLQDRTNVLVLAFIPLFAVSSLKNLGALRHVSVVCLAMVIVFIVSLISMGSGIVPVGQSDDMPPKLWSGNAFVVLRQVPLIFNAFMCQQNVPILYTELRRQKRCEIDSKFLTKRAKMMTATHSSMLLCATLYCVGSVFGNLAFCQRTQHDILLNFEQRVFSMAEYIKLCFAMVIVCSYPVMAFSCVQSLHRLICQAVDFCSFDQEGYVKLDDTLAPDAALDDVPAATPLSLAPWSPVMLVDAEKGCASQSSIDVFSGGCLLPGEMHFLTPARYEAAQRKPTPPPSNRARLTEVFCIVVFTILVGIKVPDISVVFGLTGGICCSTIMYIFPALFYLKVKKDTRVDFALVSSDPVDLAPRDFSVLLGYFVVAFGVFIGVVSTGLVLRETFQ